MEAVYVETSVIGYLTMRPSRDVVVAGHQQVTRQWWDTRSGKYLLCGSQLVVREAGAGDPQAAKERLTVVDTLTLLAATPLALKLARALVQKHAIPNNAADDALHIAIAAAYGIDYLLTWNCRHINNASTRAAIDAICKNELETHKAPVNKAPVICTPEELL